VGSTGEFRSFKLVRALENKYLGEFFSSKPKAYLVSLKRGILNFKIKKETFINTFRYISVKTEI